VTRFVALAAFLTVVLVGVAAGAAPTRVPVLVPDGDNLQYLAFWVAKGAGYFEAEGVAPDLVVPDVPAQALGKMLANQAPVAVLPPPVYVQLIADHYPVVLVANILQNDPIDVVVRKSIFDERQMSASAPLRARLESLHGLRVCVAPGPPPRLNALFASVGMQPEREINVVIRRGPEQNDAFAHDECDVLYAHTPYLEKALDDQGAVLLINQSAGEVPALANRQIHVLAVRRDFLGSNRPLVASLVRAIARAETLVRTDPDATVAAVLHALPSLEPRHVRTLVGLYRPAVPADPHVRADGIPEALALFPASRSPPSLEGIALADFVDDTLLRASLTVAPPRATRETAPRRWSLGAVLVGAVIAGLVAAWLSCRRA
jgi:ABC-type nitrate/sulfonate/bicarbonate transport system substrate-binding protein